MAAADTHPEQTAVLLMAYGSPESLEELEPYLLDIRGGRPTSPAFVAEIKERYRLIGGRSPLLDLTRQQAQALEAELNRWQGKEGRSYRTYVGMRHWQPRIREAVEQIVNDGVRRVVGLVMTPHSSRMSSGAYFDKLNEAMAEAEADMQMIRIESWHDHPGFITALSEKATEAIKGFGDAKPYVIFSAHSLPVRILKQGDPYDAQLKETAALLAGRLALEPGHWQFSYQSAGQSPEPWLGPAIEEEVKRLALSGENNILVVPVGFVCDHVEILYDLDIVCKALAREHGARLERSESLNASPSFIRALADIVEAHLTLEPTQHR